MVTTWEEDVYALIHLMKIGKARAVKLDGEIYYQHGKYKPLPNSVDVTEEEIVALQMELEEERKKIN